MCCVVLQFTFAGVANLLEKQGYRVSGASHSFDLGKPEKKAPSLPPASADSEPTRRVINCLPIARHFAQFDDLKWALFPLSRGGYSGCFYFVRQALLAAMLSFAASCGPSPGNGGSPSRQSQSAPSAPKTEPPKVPNVVDRPEQTPSGDDSPKAVTTIRRELAPLAALITQRRTGPARVQIRNYLNQHPADGQATFLFGLSYHREKKYAQAIPYYEQAAALEPDYAPIYHFAGWAHFYLGDLAASRANFEQFLKRSPNEPDSLFALGLIDLNEDKLDEAQLRFTRSIELCNAEKQVDLKALSKAHARLAEVYERQEELEKASLELQKATELYPDHYEAYYRLSRILTRLGQQAEAQLAQQKYLAAKDRVAAAAARGGQGGQD
jgi:Tfp pilus assembly protein PilF